MQLGRPLVRSQAAFALTDHEILATAQVRDGDLLIKGHGFEALLLPAEVELPEEVKGLVERFEAAGGYVHRAGQPGAALDTQKLAAIQGSGQLNPACDTVVAGRFVREGREILLLVNVTDKPYAGRVRLSGAEGWRQADPQSGAMEACKTAEVNEAEIMLAPNAALFFMGPVNDKKEVAKN